MFFPHHLSFLKKFPSNENVTYFSESRQFAHDEAEYDNQYNVDPSDLSSGKGLVNLLRKSQANFHGPALEIGCGTGLLSLGLVAAKAYPATVLSDPSLAFIKITRKKVRDAGLESPSVQYAVLLGEDADRLPANTFSLIAMRSTLHHILDVDKFIRDVARALRPGGVFACEEPCAEGYILMGAMAQFFPAVLAADGRPLTPQQAASVQLFVDTMRFYARRDVDKSLYEDKHLFRVDELMKNSASAGLQLSFHRNQTYEHYQREGELLPTYNFQEFFFNYLKYCMSFDDDLMQILRNPIAQYSKYVMDFSTGGNSPYLYGAFIFRKG
jgi:ubiquinone/menaquinone biosynthesis C-methylase UbiE